MAGLGGAHMASAKCCCRAGIPPPALLRPALREAKGYPDEYSRKTFKDLDQSKLVIHENLKDNL